MYIDPVKISLITSYNDNKHMIPKWANLANYEGQSPASRECWYNSLEG